MLKRLLPTLLLYGTLLDALFENMYEILRRRVDGEFYFCLVAVFNELEGYQGTGFAFCGQAVCYVAIKTIP